MNRSILLALSVCLVLVVSASCSQKRSPSPNSGMESGPAASAQNAPQPQSGDGFENDSFEEGDFDNEYAGRTQAVADPLESWNRIWFEFNDKLYFALLKPLTQGYVTVVPEFARTGVKNFFNNLKAPIRILSNLLQGKGKAAAVEASRFVMNTAFGFGGLMNPAKGKKTIVETNDEDLGQTLGAWGFGEGFYIVWPFLGPSTARDTVGFVGDSFLDAPTYLTPWYKSAGVKGYRTFNDGSFKIGEYEAFKDAAVEPYTAMRNAYIQNRRKKIKE